MLFAYIDPGLGQLIWLSIVSAITGVVFYIKKIRAGIVNFFLKLIGRGEKPRVMVAEPTPVGKVEARVEVKVDSQ